MVSTCFLDTSSVRNEEHFLKIKCIATDLCLQFGGNINFKQTHKKKEEKNVW